MLIMYQSEAEKCGENREICFSADRDRASLLPEMGMPVPVKGRDI